MSEHPSNQYPPGGPSADEHPSIERIFDAISGGRGRDAARADEHAGHDAAGHDDASVTGHLATCPACRATGEWIESVLDATAEGALPEPPADVLERAIAIAAELPAPVRRPEPSSRWSIARLVRDALERPALAGVRGDAAGRRELYEAEGAHLDVEVTAAPDDAARCRVTGQILIDDAPPPEGALAMLWAEGRVVARAAGDEIGVFLLDDVPPGEYRLEVWAEAAGRAIRVESLTIAPDDA